MNEKVLITGSGGLLGSELLNQMKALYRPLGVGSAQLDIRDSKAVSKFLQRMQPEYVLHAAALADVDRCQEDPETARAVNDLGTGNIAKACKEIGAKLIYYSTDYVFDGTKGTPYTEDDPTGPINVYGETKLAGEKKVLDLLDNACVMRISWLFGTAKENFLTKTLREARKRYRESLDGTKIEPLAVVSDQVSSPTWTLDIADQTRRIMKEKTAGIIHAVSENQCSRFSLAEYIFEEISWDLPLKPVKSSEYNLVAPRPLYTPLENRRLNEAGISIMRDYREAVREFLGVYKGEDD